MDPTIGIVAAMLVVVWTKNLIVETGKVLFGREMDHLAVEEVR